MSEQKVSDAVIAVVGVGALGSVLAARLAAHGHPVRAHDKRPEALKTLPETVQRVDSPAEAARGAQFVITCVTDAAAVEACVLGAGGVCQGAERGAVLIETTTSAPETTRAVAAALAPSGVDVIDAPVSRGVPAARGGTLAIWVGGAADVVTRCRPLLEELGTDILHLGALGAGHVVKAANMMLMATNLVATAEAVAVGKKWGLSLERMLEVWNVSSGGSFMTANHFPSYVASGTYASSFTTGLMHKDVGIGLELARQLGLPMLVSQRARSVYDIAMASGLAAEDNMQVVRMIERVMSTGRSAPSEEGRHAE